MMKSSFLAKSTYKKLLISCTALVILPTLIFVTFYLGTLNTAFEDKIVGSDSNSILVGGKELEASLNSIVSTGLALTIQEDIVDILQMQLDGDTKNYSYIEKAFDVRDFITDQTAALDFIHSIFIYNTHTDDIVTSRGEATTAEQYYDVGWQQGIKDIQFMKILPVRELTSDRYDDSERILTSKVMTILLPIRLNTNTVPGILVINLFNAAIPEILDLNNIMIFNSSLELINANEQSEKEYETLLNMKLSNINTLNEDEYFNKEIKIDGTNYIYHYMPIDGLNLKLIKLNPKNVLFKQSRYYLIVSLVLSIIAVIVGLFYSIRIVRNIYNPVNATLSLLNLDDKINAGKNDLQLIYETVNRTINQNKMVQKKLKEQQLNIRNGIIMKLLRGNTAVDMSMLDLDEGICCMIISVDRLSNIMDTHFVEEQFTLKTLVLQIAQSEIKKQYKAVGMLLEDDKILFLLSFTREHVANDFARRLKNIALNVQAKAAEIEGITLTCSFGNLYYHAKQIRTSYIEANRASSYRITYGTNSCIIYEEVVESRKCRVDDGEEVAQKIRNYLKTGNYLNIEWELTDYIMRLSQSRVVTYDNVMEYFYPIINRTKKLVHTSQSLYRVILVQETLDDILRVLLEIYEENVTQTSHEIIDLFSYKKIISYIDTHYNDCNLDLTMLADVFGISYSHLRKLIKEQTGYSFVEYINKIRIEHAKRLLVDSTMGVKQIAQEVGYSTEQSFFRNFKKYEGITPSKLRKIGNI